MAAKKYLKHSGTGLPQEQAATQVSTGASNGGDLVALTDAGVLDVSVMPEGIGPDVRVVTASEALAAGDLVNLWNDSGTVKVRKADASTAGKEAQGFVTAVVSSGNPATVYFLGVDAQLTGMTPGLQYLSATTPGKTTATAPTGTGQVVQRVGMALSATELRFIPAASPIVLA